MDDQVTQEKCPCSNCLVSTTCTVIADCEKWFLFFISIMDHLVEDMYNDAPILEGVNTENMKTLRELIDKMLNTEQVMSELENNYSDLDGRVSEMERSDTFEREMESKIQEAVEDRVSDAVREFEDRVDSAVSDIDNLREEFTNLETRVEEIENGGDFETQLNDLDSRVDDLEADIQDLRSVEGDVEQVKEKIDNQIMKDIIALKKIPAVDMAGEIVDLNKRVGDLYGLLNSTVPQGLLR